MKNKHRLFILIFLLAMVAAFFWKKPSRPQVFHLARTVTSNNESIAMPKVINTNVAFVISEVVTSSTGQTMTILSNRLQNPQAYQTDIESHNVPVYLYGRIIDQDSNGLGNAAVRASIRHWTVSNPGAFDIGSTEIFTGATSDSEGRFEIHEGTGDGIDVESVQKTGYELEPGQRSFGTANGSYANPVIFKMWSTNIHEQLISAKKVFAIIPDGRRYAIDLVQGSIAETGPGELSVWINYTNQVVHNQVYDWSAGISVVNGGLLEQSLGTAMYEAPASGYTPSFQLQQKIRGGQSGEIGDRQFYVQWENGQTFGRISINLYAPYNNQTPGLVRISYAINPSGSRILR